MTKRMLRKAIAAIGGRRRVFIIEKEKERERERTRYFLLIPPTVCYPIYRHL